MQVRVTKGRNIQKNLNLGNCEIDWYCQKEQEEKCSLAKNISIVQIGDEMEVTLFSL